MTNKAPRGVTDILPQDQPAWRWLRDTATRVAESYGYGEIQTPVFEQAAVFQRSGSEGTDLIDKELYAFQDRGGDDLALRADGTHGVARAYIEHGMASQPQPVRLFYIASVFRYDRPQAGRFRLHHQFGAEAIGDASPGVDAEIIDLLHNFYTALGLQGVRLLINSIGDNKCRPGYLWELQAYYADKVERLCADCRKRLTINPLRLLDCKNEPCQPFKEAAPKSTDHLCEECGEHFSRLRELLASIGIPYTLDPSLVRGIDYYARTAFEFQPAEEKSQTALGGGGRYDGLIEQLGGKSTPGIGFGAGIERIFLNLKQQELVPPAESRPDAFLAFGQNQAPTRAFELASSLREVGLQVIMAAEGRSLKSQMRQANALGARFALILGPEELATDRVSLRDLGAGTQEILAVPEATQRLRS